MGHNLNLRITSEMLISVIDSIEDGLMIVATDGTILWVNQIYGETVKMDVLPFLGKNIREYRSRLLNENLADLDGHSMINEVLRTKEKASSIVHYRTNDFILTTVTPAFDGYGEILCLLYVVKNCSAMLRQERNLEYITSKAEALQQQLSAETVESNDDIVIESTQMKKIFEAGVRASASNASVLITGESGAGKDVLARLIHQRSPRSQKQFVHINLGAVPESLFESTLFGYEPGSFTGASKNGQVGLLELADGGTVFLDEIGELSLDCQTKLLQALQERRIRRIGGTQYTPINIRVISATNRDLEQMVADKTFRLDLYYRLKVIDFYIPPLRERKDDIFKLALKFLSDANREYGTGKHFEPSIYEIFQAYPWPGNIRELSHVVKRLAIVCKEDIITAEFLPREFEAYVQNLNFAHGKQAYTQGLKQAVISFETEMISSVLRNSKNANEAAKILKIDSSTLSKKRKLYHI